MIEVRHLTKKYGNFTAVDDISFTVEKGHIYGFLGPNGAGKSTTMNIITGCLASTSGEVIVNGHDIYEEPVEAKASVGYLPEIPPLYIDMTPEEYLLFVGEAKGVAAEQLDREVEHVMEQTGITPVADRLIRNLSKGYRQRVGIAQAILGNPEIIILDEPTVGLDPLQIIEIRDLIKELGKEHTVILSSHILSEISAVCDYIIIISHGKVVASDTIEHLTASEDGHRMITLDARGNLTEIQEMLKGLSGALHTTVTYGLGGCVRVLIETSMDTDLRDDVFRLFASRDIPIVAMATNDISLEDVFLRLTEAIPETVPEDSALPDTEMKPLEEAMTNASENDDSPYYTTDKKNDSDDDYKPLFGAKK